jgi:thioesterase domain-containing protein
MEGRLPSIEAMAGEYLAVLNEAGIQRPFVLGGFCNGALIALSMARQAESLGQPIDRLVMIEPISLNARLPMRLLLPLLGARMAFVWKLIERIDEQKDLLHAAIWLVGKMISRMKGRPSESTAGESPKLRIYHRVMARFAPATTTARIGCIVTESNRKALTYSSNVWRRFGSSLDVAVVPGEHLTCITTHVEALAERLHAFLSAEEETIGEGSQPVWLPQELEKELQ